MESCAEYFTKGLLKGSRRSAAEIAPLVVELVRPGSVIDVGCGTGSWLAAFQALGIEDVLGVDGDWADRALLEIPRERFLAFDLREPLHLGRRFDLVLSLEVAQHLPAECAAAFVDSLTRLGPVVLFSAAVPFQGGIGHINEQWPDYWAGLFRKRGYRAIDCVRKKVWHHPNVEWWFAQNTLLFVTPDKAAGHPLLKRGLEEGDADPLALVHPRKYVAMAESTRCLYQTAAEIAALVPPADAFLLVDSGELENMVAAGRRALPFLEKDGEYWGPPEDDATAVAELERLRGAGARFIAFAWPAFWWLDYYAGFHHHLRSRFPCALENDRLVVFDLRPAKTAANRRAAKRQGRIGNKPGGRRGGHSSA